MAVICCSFQYAIDAPTSEHLLHSHAAVLLDGDAQCLLSEAGMLDPHETSACASTLHAVHGKRHLLLECHAMQSVTDRYPAL